MPERTDPMRSLMLRIVLISLLALGVTGLVLYVNGLLDPDKDGIPTHCDPEPDIYDGTVDADRDGWVNDYERMIGTDLTDPDQDKDGLRDGLDADDDRMSNWFERSVARRLDPTIYNGRYYLQLMSIPYSNVNETANREFWVEKERIEPDHYIIRYSVTFAEFRDLIANLSREVTGNDLVFLYLKTHGTGADDAGGEPTLCFADEKFPDQADRCGEVITYRDLRAYLDMVHAKYYAIVYSSCAMTDPVGVLAEGATNRTVIGVMGLNLGIPAEDLPILANITGNNYFSLEDLMIAIRDNQDDLTPTQRISDRDGIAERFFFGDYSKGEYRRSIARNQTEGMA
ncbi:MAG: hypothetical protein LUO93_01700 [Methanomicrobiales archaeon]|nr:hypothetical protein [Methanomicrobiales archaeon]